MNEWTSERCVNMERQNCLLFEHAIMLCWHSLYAVHSHNVWSETIMSYQFHMLSSSPFSLCLVRKPLCLVRKPLCIVSLTCCLAQSLLYAVHFHYVLSKNNVSCQFDMLSCLLVIICSVSLGLDRNHYVMLAWQVVLFTRYYVLPVFIMSCQKTTMLVWHFVLFTRYYIGTFPLCHVKNALCLVSLTCCLVKSLLYSVHFQCVLSENNFVLSACLAVLLTLYYMLFVSFMYCQKTISSCQLVMLFVNSLLYAVHFHSVLSGNHYVLSENHYVLSENH